MNEMHFVWIFLAALLLCGCESKSSNQSKEAERLAELGGQRSQQRDFKGAIPFYDQALKLNQNDGFTYFNRGAAKLNLGDYDGAIADFTAVIRLEPKLKSQAYRARAQAKHMKGDEQGAKEDDRKYYEGDR